MLKILNIMTAILIMVTLSGCLTSIKEKQRRAENLKNMIACPADRPLSCKKEMSTVCGILRDGSSWNYDSGCMACTRHVVIGFIPGPCR